tara:strand:+ start:78 stop:314 length:237 start_codon:yes stop_codon:yes gene_type:complete
MRDLDLSDLQGMKKTEIIERFLQVQEQCGELRRSNQGYRSGNTRLGNDLKKARKAWNQWRDKYYELRNALDTESLRSL